MDVLSELENAVGEEYFLDNEAINHLNPYIKNITSHQPHANEILHIDGVFEDTITSKH